MAEVLVIGKKISEMGLVSEITGEEKIPTSALGDKAVTTSQLLTYLNDNSVAQWGRIDGDITSQVDLQNQFTQERNTLKIYTQEQVSQQQVALQEHIDTTNEVFKYASENGSALPYKEGITYEEGAVVVKDGVLQQWEGGVWKSVVADSLSDTIQTFNSPEAGVDPLMGVADGAYFNVRSSSDESYADEYQNIGGVPTPSGKSYPSNMAKWDASFIVDESGKAQQELNNDVYSLTKTNAERFTNFANAIDAAPYISALANSMPDGATLLIPAGKWAIKSNCTISKQINIKCDGEIVIDGSNPTAVFRMKRDPVYTLAGTDLSSLPKKGDTKINFTNTSLFDPATHYVVLNSTEVETVRIGYADSYYKNETLDFIDSNFNLRGQVDLDYTDASKLTVRVYKKHNPVRVQINASYSPTVGQTTDLKIVEVQGYNHVTWDVSIDRTTSKNIAGTSFLYSNCVHFTFMPSCRISGGQSDFGDSYAFQNSCSSYILNLGVTYFDCGVTTKKERGYAGRHGKYVLFESCSLNGIDDHYGHHYTIRNMDFHNRGVGISGGYVTIENCNQYSASEPLYFIRTDTPYCDGELRIVNCSAKVLLALTPANNPTYSAKFKMFDTVTIRDIRAYIGDSNFINMGTFFTHNINNQSTSLEITDVKVMRTGSGRFLSDSSEGVRFKRVEVNNFRVISDVVKSPIISGIAADTIRLNNCSEVQGFLLAKEITLLDTKHGYHSTTNSIICATEKLILDNSEIIDDGGIYSTRSTQGDIYLYNSRINSWRFFAVPDFATKVVVSKGTTSNVANPISFDLFDYNKLAIDRVATATKTVGTLGVGLATSISTVSIGGARLGDKVDAAITTAANGLRVNAWVSAANTVSYYIENPTANPNGSQTFVSVDIKFNVKSI